jgi:hypothetical protein
MNISTVIYIHLRKIIDLAYSDFKDITKDIVKDRNLVRLLKSILAIVALVLLIAILSFVIACYQGKPAKLLFGLVEYSGSKDTASKSNRVVHDTIIRMEAVQSQPSHGPIQSTIKVRTGKMLTPKSDTSHKNGIILSGHNNQLNNGNGNSQTNSSGANAHNITGNQNYVGVNGDVYEGLRQRQLDDAIKAYLLTSIPNKASRIEVSYSTDREGVTYGMEIYNWLRDQGYLLSRRSYDAAPLNFDKVVVEPNPNNYYIVHVYPQSNVAKK